MARIMFLTTRRNRQRYRSCHLACLFAILMQLLDAVHGWSIRQQAPNFHGWCRHGGCTTAPLSASVFAYHNHDEDAPLLISKPVQRPKLSQQGSRKRAQNPKQNANEFPEDNPSSPNKLDLNLLVIDHYDSFTYNLVDMLGQICMEPPEVYAADGASSWAEYRQQNPTNRTIDGIVLSPGPGHPLDSICDLSHSVVEDNPDLPILGVCLGHQILGCFYGANCTAAPTPIHGQVLSIGITDESCPLLNDKVDHKPTNGETIGFGSPSEWNVTRYHSLQVVWPDLAKITSTTSLPIVPTATSIDSDGKPDENSVVMALRHKSKPHYGVQFHPESIGSQPCGFEMLERFCEICHDHKRQRSSRKNHITNNQQANPIQPAAKRTTNLNGSTSGVHNAPILNGENVVVKATAPYEVYVHKVESTEMVPENVMEEIVLRDNEESCNHRFWLDEATAQGDPNKVATSLLGGSQRRVEYWGVEKASHLRGLHEWKQTDTGSEQYNHHPEMDILAYLQEGHQITNSEIHMVMSLNGSSGGPETRTLSEAEASDQLPFAFRGGHVGYLGYEVRHITERLLAEQEHGRVKPSLHHSEDETSDGAIADSERSNPNVPTAAFVFADKTYVYDHATKAWYLVGVIETGGEKDTEASSRDVIEWMRSTSSRMSTWRGHELDNNEKTNNDARARTKQAEVTRARRPVAFAPNRSRKTYNQNFDDCLTYIRKGESYELCLTNQLEARVPGSNPFDLYKVLRRYNPAPFSAFFDWDGRANKRTQTAQTGSSVSICCSSPERFISVSPMASAIENADDHNESRTLKFQVEAKPIKGTCARVLPSNSEDSLAQGLDLDELDRERANELQSSIKNRAENLMIVDLLRNDLSRVCDVGSVHVSKLMDIESYATVHQMVSTIRGTLSVGEDGSSPNSNARISTVDVLMACFPGGSMTGAPKVRTMELLDDLEEGVARGPYSGSLGYVSLNGAIDMNKVIRTAVLTPSNQEDDSDDSAKEWQVSIGAGGAITALSESDDEYEEMILKASAVIKAVQTWSENSLVEEEDGSSAETERERKG